MKVYAVVALVAAFALPASASTTRSARVTVVDVAPFTVRGSGFVSGERVTIAVTIKSRYVHTLTASAAGTFTTRFTGVRLNGCAAYSVQARGNRGSVAFLKVVPECASPADEPQALYPSDPVPKKR